MTNDASIEAWPLVHGRTQYLDYRPALLARPAWFSEADFVLVKKFLFPDRVGSTKEFGARAFPETLRDPGGERWLYLRHGGLLVFGVLAATPLLSKVEPVMTHETNRYSDRSEPGRLLDAFVGFAYRLDGEKSRGFVPSRDFGSYERAYEAYVRPRWDETLANPEWRQPAPSSANLVEGIWCDAGSVKSPFGDDAAGRIQVFPVTDDERLWNAAACSDRNLVLLIGMPGLQYARNSAFDIVTTRETSKKLVFDRLPPPLQPPSATAAGIEDPRRFQTHVPVASPRPTAPQLVAPAKDSAAAAPERRFRIVRDMFEALGERFTRMARGQDSARPKSSRRKKTVAKRPEDS